MIAWSATTTIENSTSGITGVHQPIGETDVETITAIRVSLECIPEQKIWGWERT
jgi:hypothetical protein